MEALLLCGMEFAAACICGTEIALGDIGLSF